MKGTIGRDVEVSKAISDKKRLIRVTAGNLHNSHIYAAGHYDFLPADCYGGPRRTSTNCGKPIRIHLQGLNKTVETDIAVDARTGKPRREFRGRGWVREFFKHHDVEAGDILALEKLKGRTYRLSVVRDNEREATPQIAVAEFFAGIGLVRLALEQQGFRVVFANDIDPDKFAMYQENFGSKHFHLGDIHKLDGKQIPTCNLATASFPCNDLSIAGAMRGLNSGQSSAFWGLIRLLQKMGDRRPPFVMLENVPGFLMSHRGKDFEGALLAFNELGYACDALLLDAANFVPQSRSRLFVIAKAGVEGGAARLMAQSPLRPKVLADFIIGHPNVAWNIRELPLPPKRPTRLEAILEDLPDDDPAWWNEKRAAYFMGQLSERHLTIATKMMKQPFFSYGTAFRRVRKGRSMAELRVDGIAGCLRTPRGGSGRQILFKAGKGKYRVRLLTPRECARLQGVPDSYRINVSSNKALFGFGDAVCVPVIQWVGENYLLPCITERRYVGFSSRGG